MNAERRPSAGRGVLWITPPIRRAHLAEVVMADIGVHMQDAAERAALIETAHFLHRGFVAAFVAAAEHAAGRLAGRQNALGACCRQGQRLLAEYLLASREGRD